jgi:serine/threonine-protein kinase
MTNDKWRQIETLFQAAADRACEERASFLDQVCAGDPALRQEVESLLAKLGQETTAEGFFQTLFFDAAEAIVSGQAEYLIGRRIGAYLVTGLIGEGGMGIVVRAERADDQYHKQVAIKLIKRGMDTPSALQRFLHERQILARLEHPYIARLLEGGTTEDGLPYFVMEYVEGQPITRYCAEQPLPLGARLKLFRAVCEAVQYAHQNLVIHRDLKPSNILVTKDGTPRLLDFGVAKLLEPELIAGATARTLPGMRVLTPDYASPEQTRGETVTTATDVYSLGVLLYELLTGQRPYQFPKLTPNEIERIICQTQPVRPSLAETLPTKARRQLAGDLDNIVLMALRKEPERRYQSVEQFSEDIRRHRAGLPVIARDDRLGYRLGKFARRHKTGVSFAAVLLLLLVGFAVTMAVQTARLARERDRANQQAATAEEVTQSLVALFELADPGEAKGKAITAREILDKGAERVARELHDQPQVQARLLDTIGRLYTKIGLSDKATPLLRQALEFRQRTLGADSLEAAESLNNLGTALRETGDYEAAEPPLRQALDIRQKRLGAEHSLVADSLNNLGLLLNERGKYAEAEQPFRTALALRRKLLGVEHADVASSLNNLGLVLFAKGQADEAGQAFQEAVAILRTRLGRDHPRVASGLGNWAGWLHRKGQLNEAERLYREALAICRHRLGDDHPQTIFKLVGLASVLRDKNDCHAAEPLFKEAIRFGETSRQPNPRDLAGYRSAYAPCLTKLGRFREAEDQLRAAHTGLRATLGERHYATRLTIKRLAELYEAWGKPARAAPYRVLLQDSPTSPKPTENP